MLRNVPEKDVNYTNIGKVENEETCIGCGMGKYRWIGNNGRGYSQGTYTSCCKDCAEGIQCRCGL
jgi:hypothetical protein